ncbi:DgyrCDS7981 [Dimorphilus gyrociliatus]|uniref:DgyrCDS7981 n=1 Tax=Dimorphilus gyrociliatus TaxID=2664684 RepID=A0A7I8VST5_9ANNE|nr:DgyrCDS7981 [Dimorphilus gyrociliatus]
MAVGEGNLQKKFCELNASELNLVLKNRNLSTKGTIDDLKRRLREDVEKKGQTIDEVVFKLANKEDKDSEEDTITITLDEEDESILDEENKDESNENVSGDEAEKAVKKVESVEEGKEETFIVNVDDASQNALDADLPTVDSIDHEEKQREIEGHKVQETLTNKEVRDDHKTRGEDNSEKEGKEKDSKKDEVCEQRMQEKREDRSLWVSNLPTHARAADLKTLFTSYGTVIVAKVVMKKDKESSKVFGLIIMSKKEEAERAMNELHDTEFEEKILSITKPDPKILELAQSQKPKANSPSKRESGERNTRLETEREQERREEEKRRIKKRREDMERRKERIRRQRIREDHERLARMERLEQRKRIELQKQRDRQRQIEQLQREESAKLERERERLRMERERFEREKLEMQRLERERIRMERERIERERQLERDKEQLRNFQRQLEEQKRSQKRPYDNNRGREDWDSKRRMDVRESSDNRRNRRTPPSSSGRRHDNNWWPEQEKGGNRNTNGGGNNNQTWLPNTNVATLLMGLAAQHNKQQPQQPHSTTSDSRYDYKSTNQRRY